MAAPARPLLLRELPLPITDYQPAKIIKYIISDANVFVISHKTEDLIDSFDRVIRFEKTKGFGKVLT